MSARMPVRSFEPLGDCPCCRSVGVVPPLRALLAIHARDEDGYTTWFSGTFDGRCWWSPELPSTGGQWTVVGWRDLEEHVPDGMPPCQRSHRRGSPRLFRGTGGVTRLPQYGISGLAIRREPAGERRA